MLRPLVFAMSLTLLGSLAADIAAADPPRILGSHIRDRGGDHDDDRGRDRDEDRGDHRGDRDDHRGHDGRWDGRGDRGHDRDRGHDDRWRDYDRRDHRYRDRDRDRYSFGLYLGSPWYVAPGYYYDDYPRYRDDCRVVYRTRYDRWGRPYRERVRECYDGRYWAPSRGW